jgi:hypothetical protein
VAVSWVAVAVRHGEGALEGSYTSCRLCLYITVTGHSLCQAEWCSAAPWGVQLAGRGEWVRSPGAGGECLWKRESGRERDACSVLILYGCAQHVDRRSYRVRTTNLSARSWPIKRGVHFCKSGDKVPFVVLIRRRLFLASGLPHLFGCGWRRGVGMLEAHKPAPHLQHPATHIQRQLPV